MANGGVIVTGPGVITVPALGKSFKLTESREDDVFDSVTQASGSVSAGTSLELFRDLGNKFLQHTNLKTPRRINAESEMALTRIGVHVAQAIGNTMVSDDDIIKILHTGTLTFKINDRLVTEGPLMKYQAGVGAAGQTNRTDTGVVTNGVASQAAAPNLLVPQPISDKDDLNGTVDFKNATWISGYTAPSLDGTNVISCLLHGIIKAPLGR
ncbi:MAG TPA: hypothetical protein VEA38_03140 [Terriglobales bacterium]|nr:hypothetical protein [Terriglobales bacterium]